MSGERSAQAETFQLPLASSVLPPLSCGLRRGRATFADLAKEITVLPEPRPLESRIPLWFHWGTLAALIVLLGTFRTGRKLNSTF